MPHFKCQACRIRLHSTAPDDLVGDLCPACGSLLEPVAELAEIVGFRSIGSSDVQAHHSPAGTHQRIADRMDDIFVARRAAADAQARLDAERWADDGGSFTPEAAAESAALPDPSACGHDAR